MRTKDQSENQGRVRAAEKAIRAGNASFDERDVRSNAADLLTDLRHYCDAKDIDFAAVLDTSYEHYLAEKHGEDSLR